MSQQPAGWYDDPRDSDQLRYWDGGQWTPHTHPKAPPEQTAPTQWQTAETDVFPVGDQQGEEWQSTGSEQPYGQQSYQQEQQAQGDYGQSYGQQSYQQTYPAAAQGGGSHDPNAQQWNSADMAPVGSPAPWWRRLVARILDGLLIGLVVGVPMMFVLWGQGIDAFSLWLGVATGLVGFIYETVLLKTMSATLGKLAMGLRVHKLADEAPLSWVTAAIRSATWHGASLLSNVPIVGYAFLLFLLLNGLWPLWDGKNQSLNDKAAGTQVVFSS